MIQSLHHPDAAQGSNELQDAPIILTGVPRSGTTLLGGLANRYLDVGAQNEGDFEFWLADQGRRRPADLLTDASFEALLKGLAEHEYFKIMYKSQQPDVEAIMRDLRERTRVRSVQGIGVAVLQFTAQKMGRKRLGHEDPHLISNLDKVFEVFPRGRLIQIIRDPRDVAASVIRFPWGANNVVVAAGEWNRCVARARALGAELGPERYLEVRYEDLLQKPAETMTALMQFVCGEVDTPQLTAFVQEMQTNPLRNNNGKWRRQLTPRQVQRVEACAGEQMGHCNYALEYPQRRMGRWSYAVWKLHHRAIQLKRMMSGKLTAAGGAKLALTPEEYST